MGYKEARTDLNLSREEAAALVRRAGYAMTSSGIERLEASGQDVVGTRGLKQQAVQYLEYLLGMTQTTIDWSGVAPCAPVLVLGDKGQYQFTGYDAETKTVTVFGGRGFFVRFRTLPTDQVRVISPRAVPPLENAVLFESRAREADGNELVAATDKIAAHIDARPTEPHAVGAVAYALGLDNGATSRVMAQMAKDGKLAKVSRGVFIKTQVPDEQLQF